MDEGTLNIKKHEEEIVSAFGKIVDLTNLMGLDYPSLGEKISRHITQHHRTLQQSFWRTIAATAQHYKNVPCDLRSEASVEFCKKISEIDAVFPFV